MQQPRFVFVADVQIEAAVAVVNDENLQVLFCFSRFLPATRNKLFSIYLLVRSLRVEVVRFQFLSSKSNF